MGLGGGGEASLLLFGTWCNVARACAVVVVVVLCLSMCGVGLVLGWPSFRLGLRDGMLLRCTCAVS